jgi:hypothetical protein
MTDRERKFLQGLVAVAETVVVDAIKTDARGRVLLELTDEAVAALKADPNFQDGWSACLKRVGELLGLLTDGANGKPEVKASIDHVISQAPADYVPISPPA